MCVSMCVCVCVYAGTHTESELMKDLLLVVTLCLASASTTKIKKNITVTRLTIIIIFNRIMAAMTIPVLAIIRVITVIKVISFQYTLKCCKEKASTWTFYSGTQGDFLYSRISDAESTCLLTALKVALVICKEDVLHIQALDQ